MEPEKFREESVADQNAQNNTVIYVDPLQNQSIKEVRSFLGGQLARSIQTVPSLSGEEHHPRVPLSNVKITKIKSRDLVGTFNIFTCHKKLQPPAMSYQSNIPELCKTSPARTETKIYPECE